MIRLIFGSPIMIYIMLYINMNGCRLSFCIPCELLSKCVSRILQNVSLSVKRACTIVREFSRYCQITVNAVSYEPFSTTFD